ncbi:MAG: hypothetical protein B6D35_04090 [Candidatus Brocadia sp. UTAMX2]|nr:MAG: hypothetical protein B6D35_04090 [Candidatus Brocadia sp. UTAMX2]
MGEGLQDNQKTVTLCPVTKQTFSGGFAMKISISKIMALFLIGGIATGVFAANGNKGDWGFDPKYYNYALIEGEITSIDHDKGFLRVEGKDEQIFFCEHTEFFRGDISLPMERVFHAVKFNNDQKIESVHVNVGDMIKSRYSKFSNGKIYLDTCLAGEDLKPGDVTGSKDNTLLSKK